MGSDEDVVQLGKKLLHAMNQAGPSKISFTWWENQLMELSMAGEAFKVRMFHFVDVFPILSDSHEVARHFAEYFPSLEGVPKLFKAALAMAKSGWAPDFVIAKATEIGIGQMAKKFICGQDSAQALSSVESLRKKNLTFSMDVLGESTLSESEADQCAQTYAGLMTDLAQRARTWKPNPQADGEGEFAVPRVNVSIKISSLYSQMNPMDPVGCCRAIRDRVRPLFRLGRDLGVSITIDMEQYSYKEIVLGVFKGLLEEDEFRQFPHAGVVLQAYLRETERDLLSLIDWTRRRGTPVHVRLVKGAYWDYETVICDQKHWSPPVFTRKWQSDANYEKLSGVLLDNYRLVHPMFASHNIRSVASAMIQARQRQVPVGALEFQVLYGMGDSIAAAVSGEGYRCRVYCPFGRMIPGMGYLVRRLLENTSNDSFLLQTLQKDHDEDSLLMAPAGPPEAWHNVAPPPSAVSGAVPLHQQQDTAEGGGATTTRAGFVNIPEVDWMKEQERNAMTAALDKVKSELGKTYGLVIDGKEIVTATLRDSVNPSHFKQVIGKVSQAQAAHAQQAIEAARRAFETWRDVPAQDRVNVLVKAAEICTARKYELSAWECLEAGKPWAEAMADVEEAIDYLNYYAAEMTRLAKPLRMGNVAGEINDYFYEAKGVGVVISPWNFPLAILAGMSVAAVVTGNAVVIKPSNNTPVIGAKFMAILAEAGLPAGVANFVPGPGDTIGEQMVTSPEVNFIAFTGSRDVGLRICEQAARTPGARQGPKRVIAEMGGKNALIIDSDCDLDEAVAGTVKAAFGYAGQKCSACSRAIVLEGVYERFCDRLKEAVASLTVGPADEPGTFVPPVIDAAARESILRYIEIGKQEGRVLIERDVRSAPVRASSEVGSAPVRASFQTPDGVTTSDGFYVGPTVLVDVDAHARVAQEEIFGPVLVVIKARNLDHAIDIANDTDYALTGGVFSRSPKTLHEVRRRFRVGNLYINRPNTGAVVARQPFGGFKMSGIGSKAGGPDYLTQFVNPRTTTENTLRRGFAATETD
jgi:RHH-type proline utilization regulon transcriptional repressor/proline dehydrogenase/delta 1-pyrroline-5-carboxylate dehydrogenase